MIARSKKFECPMCHEVWTVYWWVVSRAAIHEKPLNYQACPFCGEVIINYEPDSKAETS